jgi:hypothetical protein
MEFPNIFPDVECSASTAVAAVLDVAVYLENPTPKTN